VGRPVDHRRRAELLDAVVDYATEHQFSELTWRPLAAALGVSTTTLVHRFGSKEQMLEAIFARLQERTLVTIDAGADLATAARAIWQQSSDPGRGAEFRLFFAVYGQALQAPELFAAFLDHVVADALDALTEAQGPAIARATAARTATLVVAFLRGLLFDLLATGERARVDGAAQAFLASLEHPA
jgi:AcrR family transcriptional regulator